VSDKKDGFCFSFVVKETTDKGLGVFAGEAIKLGSVVWRHVPSQYIVYDEQTFKAAIAKMTHADVVYELTHIFGLQDFPGCLIRVFDAGVLFNDSSDPNLITNNKPAIETSLDETSTHYIQDVTKALLDVRYAMVATRDIEIGEEFTNDYSAECCEPPFYDILYEQYGIDEGYLDGHQ
jgi:hypothetical protein